MLGRTGLNYGADGGIITMKDIDYMYNIVDSDLDEQAKAIKLYSFCNQASLKNSIELYNDLELKQVKKLEELVKIYKDYEKKGLFKSVKNPYKCTLEEIALRIKKLNSVYDIINSDNTDYAKAEQLLSLFKSAEEFRKTYSLYKKYGKKDERLSSAREALDNIDTLYSKFKEYEEKDIIGSVRYLLSIENYIQYYDYAEFAITYYINSSESYKEYDFLATLGIDKETLEFCASVIEELNVDLYKQFLEKKEQNNKIRCIKNTKTITDLANGIETGVLSDGSQFDLLEFTKRIPFKRNQNFEFALIDFMKRNNPNEMKTILKYIYSNGLNMVYAFEPLDIKSLYSAKFTVNGIEITNEDNDIIIDYLKVNNIPLISKNYVLARTKYLNGEITKQMVEEKKSRLNKQTKILIPGKK